MKKKKITNQVVSVTIPPTILSAIDKYCENNYIPRTSFFVKAAKEFLDKNTTTTQDSKNDEDKE